MATKEQELAEQICRKFEKLRTAKQKWNTMYQDIGEFIRLRKQDFTRRYAEGEFVTDSIFDTTAVFANRAMAAALLGALFPNGAKTVEVSPPDDLSPSKKVKEYYEWVSKKLAEYMERREAGLSLRLDEYMLDAGAFGWGGVTVHDEREDYETPIKYSNWDAKHTYIDENTYGWVDTVYYEKAMKVFDIKNEYGMEALSDKGKEAIKQSRADVEEKILIAIQPREQFDPSKKGNKAKPFASYHLNLETKKMLKESGFDYLPPTIGRFSKNSDEVYGRGPGVDSFPDVKMANAMNEFIIRAAEKQLDPPMAILDDGTLGSDMVDTSPGATNVLSYTGRLPSTNPMFPLFTVGESRSMKDALQETRERISQHFLIDRLLDFNNDVRMTLGETQIRERIRGQSLAAIFNRQISEMFDPLIKKSFNILFERGFLGVVEGSDQAQTLEAKGVEVKIIPQEVVDRINSGKEVYNLRYISPAVRTMEKEEVTSLLTLLDTVTQAAGAFPGMVDYVNEEQAVKILNNKTGGNEKVLRSLEEVKDIRAARAEQVAKQQRQEAIKTGATAARDIAQAQQMAGPQQ